MMCIALSLALIFLAIAIPVRTLWVFNWRTKLNRFENGEHVIDGYVDYDTMMIRFWVWDIDRLKVLK